LAARNGGLGVNRPPLCPVSLTVSLTLAKISNRQFYTYSKNHKNNNVLKDKKQIKQIVPQQQQKAKSAATRNCILKGEKNFKGYTRLSKVLFDR